MWTGSISYRRRQWQLLSPPTAADGNWLDAVLAARGLSAEAAADFITPAFKGQLPDPFSFRDMKAAAVTVADALAGGAAIGVLGDYDVDGATSAAILVRFFAAARAACGLAPRQDPVHIPDRMTEGYGPNLPALLGLRDRGAAVAICVDSGTMAFDALAGAAAAGLPVVVLDHHVAEARLPVTAALVNANRQDEDPEITRRFGHLCAAGLAFLFCVALLKEMQGRALFQAGPPPLDRLLDLVAMGTVADVVRLEGLNRVFVHRGLAVMERLGNPGIRALAQANNLAPPFDAGHIGFKFGPCINAGGRIGQSDLGVRLLTTDDPKEAAVLAASLVDLNEERKTLCNTALDEAVQKTGEAPTGLVLVAGPWHPGIIGVVAGRLKERFDRPVIVVSLPEGAAAGPGSARSIPGFDIGQAIIAAGPRNPADPSHGGCGILVRGGGHPMAGGLTIEAARLADFQAYLDQTWEAAAATGIFADKPKAIDLAIFPHQASVAALRTLDGLEPCGQGNPGPRIAVIGGKISKVAVRGGRHVSVTVERAGHHLSGIAFQAVGTVLGDALLAGRGAWIDLVGRPAVNDYNGAVTMELRIEDAMWIGKPR